MTEPQGAGPYPVIVWDGQTLPPTALSGSNWRKGSLSGADGCVEVRFVGEKHVQFRDSKDPDGPILTFSNREWTVFKTALLSGEF